MSPRVTFLDWEQLLARGTQPHVTAGHSYTSNLAKCHKRVLKYNIKVFNVLFVTKDFKGHLEEAWGLRMRTIGRKVNVKLSLRLIKQHAMKGYWGWTYSAKKS